ncbi:protein of unknown function [Pseudomonas sp. JV551A1]|uniref:Uncharacterized protein n=1 Tax=Pseudomonas inefficax TaxID=2078786 RepID=A0AAQ1PAG4_9PSED|nr:protein of unknown function [Pseudomonas sp. JV551A1]SPO61548.1 protein of unknown function [Pseudomonas inefficax]
MMGRPGILYGWAGLFAGMPAPTGDCIAFKAYANPVGAGEPAKNPPPNRQADAPRRIIR